MIRFFLFSVGYFVGSSGLMVLWYQDMSQWGWLVASILWALLAGGGLFEYAHRRNATRR